MRQNKWKLGFLIIMVIIVLLKWQFRVKESSMFTTLIDQTETKMITLEQDDFTKQLLDQFNPVVYVHKDSYKPVDFYETYLPNTLLYQSGFMDKKVAVSVNETSLKTYYKNNLYYLDYQIEAGDELQGQVGVVPVYGRAYKSSLYDKELIFLKYTYVFPYSGLPENIDWYKKIGSNVLGDPKAWHELDIHGAVHVVLYDNEAIAVLLAQHNSHSTYILDGGPIEISFAKFSNEPYLTLDGKKRLERAVGNPLDMDFLLKLTDKVPLTGGYDEVPAVDSSVKLQTVVRQLPLDDPLYTTHMSLGDRHKILGIVNSFYMEGPPGVNYYTMPDLLDLSDLMAFWYIQVDDDYLELYHSLALSFKNYNVKPLIEFQKKRMYEKLFE